MKASDNCDIRITSADIVSRLFPKRNENANKGSVGAGMLAAGSYRMPGAAAIACAGAVNSGIGLLTLTFPDAAYNAVTAHLTEPVLFPVKSDINGFFSADAADDILSRAGKNAAAAVGPGIGTGDGSRELTRALVTGYDKPLLLDADALNIIATNPDILLKRTGATGITPHPGEMSRLTGLSIPEIQADREKTALSFAVKYGVTVLLKGHDTVIACPDGEVFINPTGCPAMARGGCGDLLTGMALSFLAQGLTMKNALVAAAFLHGKAGQRAAEKYGEYCATVSRIAEEIRIG